MSSTRLGPGTFERSIDGIGTVLYTKTQVYSDGTPMSEDKCDGLNYIRVDYEYFKASDAPIFAESEPSFSDDTFDI